jgi:hypothetical protein
MPAWGLFGGGDASMESNFKQTRKNLIKNTSEFITENSNEIEVSSINKNLSSIKIGGSTMPGCPIVVGQSIASETIATADLNNQQINELQSSVKDQVMQEFNRSMEKARGMVPNFNQAVDSFMGTDTSQTINTDIEDIMENITKTTISTDNYNKVLAESFNENTGEIKIGGDCGAGITVDQNIVSSIVATALIDNVLESISKNETIKKLDQVISEKMVDKTEGVSDVLGALGGPWVVAGVASSVCMFCVVFVVLIMMSGGGGGGGGGNNAAGAALRAMPMMRYR